jgi:regulator of protease activity HflC (stomatin/prohibitin superfamily)
MVNVLAGVAGFLVVPVLLGVARMFGLFVVVRERQCVVFELFGTVRLVLDRPGLHSPLLRLGPAAMLLPLFGRRHVVDLRLDQEYLRSEPVNSEEGAPMGIGIWYEMVISDPVAFLYKNADPGGSLQANVSNAAVRCLSNMRLDRMLVDRHEMSRTVREEASRHSQEWGYQVGSVYVRKVHFRDTGMIRQIEQKVVNRLRQVTAAIEQDGANRVNVIRSASEREAAIEFAKAATMRPRIVGEALASIAGDPEIAHTLFEVLEAQGLLSSRDLQVTMVPQGSTVLVGATPDAPAKQPRAKKK